MNVLSLFNGISCGRVALERAGIKVDRYVSFEIDKYANTVAQKNYPDDEYFGDVTTADFTQYKGFDLVIGGSPCTYWSIAKTNREVTPDGMGGQLFMHFVRAVKETGCKYFLYENNYSIHKDIKAFISEKLGVEPIMINSALVSAQLRKRCYWTNIPDVEQPADRGILLKDILISADRKKSRAIISSIGRTTTREYFKKQQGQMAVEPVSIRIANINSGTHIQDRIYSINGKSVCIKANGGGSGAVTGLYAIPVLKVREATKKGIAEISIGNCFDYEQPNSKTRRGQSMIKKSNCLTTHCHLYQYYAYAVEFDENGAPTKAVSYADSKTYDVKDVKNGLITVKGKEYPIKLIDGYYIIRKLTPVECERLQTLPDNYTEGISDTQRYKCIGNGWTVDVIAHILSYINKSNQTKAIQLSLFS